MASRIAVHQLQSDGYVENNFLNRDDTQQLDELTARLNVNAKPTDDAELQFSAIYINTDNGYDGFSLTNTPNETISDEPGADRLIAKGFSFQARTEFVGFDLYTLLSHLDNQSLYSFDEDWTDLSRCVLQDCAAEPYSSSDRYFRDGNNTVFDTRFQSNTLENVRITVGLYARERNEELFRGEDPDNIYYSDVKYRSYAAYGNTSFLLTEDLKLTLGARVDRFDADFKDNNQTQLDSDDDNVALKLALSYKLNADTMLYGLTSRGYKPGGFNALLTDNIPDQSFRSFESESLINFELGVKGLALDNQLRYAVALFHQERRDVQVSTSLVTSQEDGELLNDSNSCPCNFEGYLANAAEGSNQGLEVSLDYLFTSEMFNGTRVSLNLGLLDTEYDDFVSFSHVNADTSNLDPIPVDLSGREQAHAPSYTFDLGFEAPISLGQTGALSVQANVEAKDAFFVSASNDEQTDSYAIANASLRYAFDDWSIRAYVKNVTDREIQTRGFFFGNDPLDGYQSRAYYQYGAPRTFGLDLRYEF